MTDRSFEIEVTGALSKIQTEIGGINKSLVHIQEIVESDHDEISKLVGKDALHVERIAQLSKEIARNCQNITDNRKWLSRLDKRDRTEARWVGGVGALGVILASLDHIWKAIAGG